MNRYFQGISTLLIVALLAGCETYSKYTIDEKPLIKTDQRLLGIWREIGNSGRVDYMIVQNYNDEFNAALKRQNNMELFTAENYKAVEGKDYDYYITDIDNSKQAAEYNQYTCFTSKIGDVNFINADDNFTPYTTGRGFVRMEEESRYFFTKIAVNETYDIITLSNVADTTLKKLVNSKQVRHRITANLNNPAFYSDTTRFYKVSNFHSSLSEAIRIANKKK